MKNEKVLSRKEVIDSKILIGVDITKIKGILGYWWVCSNNYTNPFTGSGVYTFNRAGHGRLEVHTQHSQNENGYQNLVVEVL